MKVLQRRARLVETRLAGPRIDLVRSDAEVQYTRGEEIAHAVTHGTGLLLSAAGLAALVVLAGLRGSSWHVAGCAIFGTALVLLYSASTLYHGVRSPGVKRILRRLDHSAIFVLIAGTYTPFLLVDLGGGWSRTLLCVVWSLAIAGIVLEVAIPSARRWSLPIYLAMGWSIVVVAEPLSLSLGRGGLAYTVGAVFYSWKRLPYNHAVWHLFVLAGSSLHFACVLRFVIPPGA